MENPREAPCRPPPAESTPEPGSPVGRAPAAASGSDPGACRLVEASDVPETHGEVPLLSLVDRTANREIGDDLEGADGAIGQPVRAEVFNPFDAEPELHDVVLGQELRGQEDLGAEADDRIVLLEEVHGRDADEPGNERVGWLVVDLS